jgi:adenine/guanine/hypoxanthine permease
MAVRVKGALLISIIVTTIVAIVMNSIVGPEQSGFAPNTAVVPTEYLFNFDAANFGIILQPLGYLISVFQNPEVPLLTVLLVIFSLMMADFFDTMGTVIGIGEQGEFLDEQGRLPGIRNVLIVDSLGAVTGGAFGVSSNTTYIESAAGVSEGGRTGLTAVVVGVLFLVAILFAPIAGIVPAQATAPALVVVGFLMFNIARDFEWGEIDVVFPALATLIVMPLTFSITEGIAAGFVTFGFLKLVTGRWREVHPLMWLATVAFAFFFAVPWLQAILAGAPPAP